jgi:AGZA family xanthine/uracil permease-like MFS transporter
VFSGEKVALGYGFAAVICLAFAYLKPPLRELDPNDPEDVEGAAFEGGAEEIDPTPTVNGQRATEPVGV